MTTTAYLRLRIPANATADTAYNLQRIDELAQNMADQLDGSVTLRSPTDLTLEPQAAARGGAGAGGTVNVGTASHAVVLNLYASTLNMSGTAGLLDQASGGTKYLRLRHKSDQSGAADTAADRSLTVDPQGADRALVLGGDLTLAGALSTAGAFPLTLTATGATTLTLPTTGTLATLAGAETLSAKTLTAPDVATSLRLLAQAPLRLADADSSNFVALRAPSTVSADVTWTLPGADGTLGQVLATNGSGTLLWANTLTDVLAQYNVRVGNGSGVAMATDTSVLGDVQASTTGGFAVKPGVITAGHLAGGITYAKLSLSAGDIPLAKLAPVTASRALVSDGSGVVSASVVTATELGYVSGVTSAIQTQLAARLPLAGGTLSGALTLAADAVNPLEPVSKQQFDAAVFGLYPKAPVLAATTANITLSGAQTVDGVALVAGNRCLVRAQSTSSQNGVYVVAAGAWTRATDFDSWAEVPGSLVSVEAGGTVNGGSLWMCTAVASGTVGSTAITFSQVSGPGTYTADGQAIQLTGTQFGLVLNGTTLSQSASGLKVAALGITNAEIATSAAIAYSKLALTGSVTNADLAGSIAYSKLVLTGSVTNADLAGSIAYSKLTLTGGIVNADINASAAIAYSKLALGGSIATADLASGLLVPIGKGGTGQTTAAGAWAALSQLGTKGDLHTFSTVNTVLGVGADGTVLSADSTQTTGLKWISPLVNPMTTPQDIIVGGTSGAANRSNTSLLGDVKATAGSSTVTVTIAAPGVVSFTSHGLSTGDKVYLTTTGALPTGLTASTTYYVVVVDANSFSLATSRDNAIAGTKITTTGSQSGTHTLFYGGLQFATNTFYLGNGTAAAPSLAFSSDADGSGTGIYRAGANNLGFAANGTATGDISSAGKWTIGPTARASHVINGRFQLPVLVESSSAGVINDYSPGDYGVIYFSSASAKTLNSIVAPTADGTVIWIFNSGGAMTVGNLGGGTVAYQIDTGTGGTFTINGTGCFSMIYINGFWRVISSNSGL